MTDIDPRAETEPSAPLPDAVADALNDADHVAILVEQRDAAEAEVSRLRGVVASIEALSKCGGCSGKGSHRRYCAAVVGITAAKYGALSIKAEDIGDTVGNPDLANAAWSLASRLRAEAETARCPHVAQPGSRHEDEEDRA